MADFIIGKIGMPSLLFTSSRFYIALHHPIGDEFLHAAEYAFFTRKSTDYRLPDLGRYLLFLLVRHDLDHGIRVSTTSEAFLPLDPMLYFVQDRRERVVCTWCNPDGVIPVEPALESKAQKPLAYEKLDSSGIRVQLEQLFVIENGFQVVRGR